MDYLTLDEAVIYATNKKGVDITSSELLRAGVYGDLLLTAPFGFGRMYNATESKEEDFKAQLLIIPPSHLMEIETEGSTRIMAAFSIDGKKLYFPHKEVTHCKIRVIRAELDRFLINLIQTNKEPLKESKPTEPATAKNVQPVNLLKALERQDDWCRVINEMVNEFHAKNDVIPTATQVWNLLCTQPPHGYAITTGKDKGDEDCLNMTGYKSLGKNAFDRRMKNYTK